MKTKKIVIQSMNDLHKMMLKHARAVESGSALKPMRGEYFESLEAVRHILTDRRLDLWRTIRDQEPESITELTQLVKRNFSDVHKDLNLLIAVGLVTLRKPKGTKTRARKPVSLADQLQFEVA